MVKETRERWPRKESLVHMLCPFFTTALAWTLGVFWHWQVCIKPWQATRFPFLGLPSVITRHHKTTEQDQMPVSCKVCYSSIQAYCRVSKVKQKTCILRKQRLDPWVFLSILSPQDYSLCWTMSDLSSLKKIYLQDQGPGLITEELLCSRLLLKWKGTEEASDIDIRKGVDSTPPLVLERKLYTF